MTRTSLLWRSLLYFWRTNLAVIAGVAIAVATLAGALLVGDSVRGSLRALVLNRLGNTQTVVTAAHFFREGLADDLGGAPLIALEGVVANPRNKSRSSGVQVYGIDERFWRFHGRDLPAPADREVYLSEALARELDLKPDDPLLVRLEKPSAIPKESLHGRKDEATRTIRFSAGRVLKREELGEFSLRPSQGEVRAIFLPLTRLQRDLQQARRINTVLLPDARTEAEVEPKVRLEDLGMKIRRLEGSLAIESESALLNDAALEAIRKALPGPQTAIFSYLANTIRTAEREIPYSLVAAVDPTLLPPSEPDSLFLTKWAADDLRAKPGEMVQLDYYLWEESGTLTTRSARFKLAGILPMQGLAVDRNLTPDYPGITDADTLGDWDPPFPLDLKRVRPQDEAFWKQYRTSPKALIRLETGRGLWASRFGKATSVRIPAGDAAEAESKLRAALNPAAMGMAFVNPRQAGLAASQGATDFGQYFTYFSFFLVIAALLLAGLFFRLGIEQRLREIGALRALGYSPKDIARQFFREGALLALLGSLLGVALGVGYATLLLYALRTWWRGAVGTTLLELHVTPASLAAGAAGGFLIALLWIWWTLRGLRRQTPRGLMAGVRETPPQGPASRRPVWIAAAAFGGALLLIGLAIAGSIPQAGAFFGAGFLLLAAALLFQWMQLRTHTRSTVGVSGRPGLAPLGYRNTAYRPGRSLLSITLIALATFLLVSLDAFRRPPANPKEKASGTGGFPFLAEAQLPVFYDLNTAAGQESLGLGAHREALSRSAFVPFRLRPGEDASCLNLYAPRNPRVLGARAAFLEEGRFRFQASLAQTEAEKRNPWLLLARPAIGGAIPAVVDANSLEYVLHKKLGDELVLEEGLSKPVRLRIVGALADSIFQSELIISEENFLRAFPAEQGYRVWLVDTPGDLRAELPGLLEEGLSDYGLDVVSTPERLAAFHQVENTYLTTFQALGGLGLLLGTLGLAAVLLRNVLERRKELGLLRAVGYTPAQLSRLVLAENLYLLAAGLLVGAACAALAIAPAFLSRGGQAPNGSLALLLAIPVVGLLASVWAVRSVVRAPLVSALKSD
jgi:hypothetical protein